MQLLTKSRVALLGAILMAPAALTMTTVPAVASVIFAVSTPTVPILGRVALKQSTETGHPAGVGTLHGVRRIPGGTVIYYSLGFPSSATGSPYIMGLEDSSPGFSRASATTAFAKTMLVDPASKKVYTGLVVR